MFYNERDVEIPELLAEVVVRQPSRFLDIGANYSYYYYTRQIRALIPHAQYTAIDILNDDITRGIVDEYIQGNANEVDLKKHDLVSCISTIEHAGLSTYKAENIYEEGDTLFQTILDAVDKNGSFILSFPFGHEHVVPDQAMNITKARLEQWNETAEAQGFWTEMIFELNDNPSLGGPWTRTEDIDEANIPYDAKRGCQCVCIYRGVRNGN